MTFLTPAVWAPAWMQGNNGVSSSYPSHSSFWIPASFVLPPGVGWARGHRRGRVTLRRGWLVWNRHSNWTASSHSTGLSQFQLEKCDSFAWQQKFSAVLAAELPPCGMRGRSLVWAKVAGTQCCRIIPVGAARSCVDLATHHTAHPLCHKPPWHSCPLEGDAQARHLHPPGWGPCPF